MRAVVYQAPDDIRLEEVPEPVSADPEDAIVRVTTASICGSDLHVLHGLMPKMDAGAHHRSRVRRGGGAGGGGGRTGSSRATGWWARRPCGAAGAGPAGAAFSSACETGRDLRQRPAVRRPGRGPGRLRAGALRHVTLQPIPAGLSDEQVIFAGDILPTAYSAVAGLAPGSRGRRGRRQRGDLRRRPGGAVRRGLGQALRPGARSSWWTWRPTVWRWPPGWAPILVIDASTEDVRKTDQGSHRRLGRRLRGRGRGQAGDPGQRRGRGGARAGWSRWWASSSSPRPSTLPACWPRTSPSPSGMGDLGRMQELVELIEAGRLDLTPLITHRMQLADVIRAYEIFEKRTDGAIKILLTPVRTERHEQVETHDLEARLRELEAQVKRLQAARPGDRGRQRDQRGAVDLPERAHGHRVGRLRRLLRRERAGGRLPARPRDGQREHPALVQRGAVA